MSQSEREHENYCRQLAQEDRLRRQKEAGEFACQLKRLGDAIFAFYGGPRLGREVVSPPMSEAELAEVLDKFPPK